LFLFIRCTISPLFAMDVIISRRFFGAFDQPSGCSKYTTFVRQMAVFLKTDPQSVRRLELNPQYSTSRRPSPRLQLELQEVLDRYE